MHGRCGLEELHGLSQAIWPWRVWYGAIWPVRRGRRLGLGRDADCAARAFRACAAARGGSPMSDTYTVHYGFTKPDPGASDDTWGDKVNVDLDQIDSLIKSFEA